MSQLERLHRKYADHVQLPWPRALAGPQRVWFVIYDEDDERRLRSRIESFHLATRQAGHGWIQLDLTDVFGDWMAGHPYRDHYFEGPGLLKGSALAGFRSYVTQRVRGVLSAADGDSVVALTGVAGLFGFVKVSDLVRDVESDVAGRLVVFFPGAFRNNVYRLLDRRDGWNYLAVPLANP